jgi:hypothetical protein
MTDETGAAAPTDVQAPIAAPAGSEQAKPEAGIEGAAPDAETTKVQEQSEPEGEDSQDDKPKRLTRSQRLQRTNARLANENAELYARLEAASKGQSPQKDSEPKEADFNGDYFAYQRALTAWEVKKEVREEFETHRKVDDTKRMAARQREMIQDFEERSEDFRERIPDFDKTLEAFVKEGGRFSPVLVEELHTSDVGPALAYQLAKNPQLANALNEMSPREVAREIGRLEAKVSLPNPNKQTKAPPPLSTPKGGAAQPADLHSLAKSFDATAFIRAREQQIKARAKS